MQSQQEEAIAAFIQSSFGAQFLYLPLKIHTKGSQREPADLAWVNEDFVVLFYLTRSSRGVAREIAHNVRQARGFLRRWRQGKDDFKLRGRNRFGDVCDVAYSDVQRLLVVSIGGSRAGIYPIDREGWNSREIFLSIPDALLEKLATIGCAVVDLLNVCHASIAMQQKCSIYSDAYYYKIIHEIADEYIGTSLNESRISRLFNRVPSNDHTVIRDILAEMKFTGTSARPSIDDAVGRATMTSIFGDLSLAEYTSLASAVLQVIALSGPKFEQWIVAEVKGLHYRFIVSSIKLGSNNTKSAIHASAEAAAAKPNQPGAIQIIYADVDGLNDFRSPLMFALPPQLPTSQANLIFDRVYREFSVSTAEPASLIGPP
jgi:hypothetical protein